MLTFKLSDERMAKLKIATAEQLESFLDASEALAANLAKLTTEKETMSSENKSLSEKLTALDSRIATLETSISTFKGVDVADILRQTKEAASREVIAAIAKIGGSAIRATEGGKDVTSETTASGRTTDADFAAEFKASKNLQAEFITEKDYVVYRQRETAGLIRFSTKKE
jgi:hypothetical protein